jgi:hypothetical protein
MDRRGAMNEVLALPNPIQLFHLCSPPLVGGGRGGGSFPLTSVLSRGGKRKAKGCSRWRRMKVILQFLNNVIASRAYGNPLP